MCIEGEAEAADDDDDEEKNIKQGVCSNSNIINSIQRIYIGWAAAASTTLTEQELSNVEVWMDGWFSMQSKLRFVMFKAQHMCARAWFCTMLLFLQRY